MSAQLAQLVGTLEATPFGALLIQALDEERTGTLVLEEPSGLRHGVFFEAGTPSRARIAAPAARLGEVLVETGALSPSVCERTLARALAERILHGQILLNEGLISEEALDQGLSEQLARQIAWLFGQPRGTRYGYFAGRNLLRNWGGPRARHKKPLELLWRGLRDHARSSEIEAALTTVVGHRIALIEGLPPDHFDFMTKELAIIERIKARPQYVTDLIAGIPALEADVKRVVCFLVLTRSMQFGVPSAPPAGTSGPFANVSIPPPSHVPNVELPPPSAAAAVRARTEPPPNQPATLPPPRGPGESARFRASSQNPPAPRRPSGSVPALAARSASLREEARQRLERIGRGHYEVLGVRPDAGLGEVQAAFFRIAKRWHPDRLGAESATLEESATQIYASAAEACRVLSDPSLRRDYDRDRAAGPRRSTSHDAMAKVLASELAFQRAEAFLARGNLAAARAEAERALEHEPGRAENLALAAWLAALAPGADVAKIAVMLSRARRTGAGSPKVHFYAGRVLQHLGRHSSALREYRLVLDKDPRNVDAAREVRIYEARLRKGPKDRASPAPQADQSAARASVWARWLKR